MKFKPKKILLWAGVVIAAVVVGSWIWYEVSLSAPNSKDKTAVSFDLPKGEKTTTTADRLQKAKLIRDKNAFLIYITLHGIRAQLQAGSYSLSGGRSAPEIAAILSRGKIASNLLIIPEGKTLTDIEALAEKKGLNLQTALAASYDFDFLKGAPSLEGYLFPDSYQVSKNTTADELVRRMLENFKAKVPGKYTQAFSDHGLNLNEGLTLASIIEREVNDPADRPVVAQIFLSRLSDGMALESDVTVEYASKLAGVDFNIKINSPYNTYRFAGLPPGPICSPGLSAMDAVAHPASTDYRYFVTGADGKTRFATTFQQQQSNIDQFGLLSK